MKKNLKLTVQYATDPDAIPTKAQFKDWVRTALTQPAEITIRIVDEPEGRDLNQRFRGKNTATNVLTFCYDNLAPLTGDIVLCAKIIENEAREQHKAVIAHYAHLTVHGVLHLQGFNHENDKDATIMEKLETNIVTSFGFDNPYKQA